MADKDAPSGQKDIEGVPVETFALESSLKAIRFQAGPSWLLGIPVKGSQTEFTCKEGTSVVAINGGVGYVPLPDPPFRRGLVSAFVGGRLGACRVTGATLTTLTIAGVNGLETVSWRVTGC